MVNDLLSSAVNQNAPEIQLCSALLSGPEVSHQLMRRVGGLMCVSMVGS